MRVRYHGSHVLTIENSQKCAYSVYLLIKGSERSCKTPTKLHSAHFGKCMPPPASLCPTFPFHSCLESVWASGTPRWRQESSDLQKSLLEGTVGILLANPFFFIFIFNRWGNCKGEMRVLHPGWQRKSVAELGFEPQSQEQDLGSYQIWLLAEAWGSGQVLMWSGA